MSKKNKLLTKMRQAPQSVTFAELVSLCETYFGAPRNTGGSHVVFKMPWPGDPRVNIQKVAGGHAKPYQVRQVLAAIERFEKEVENK